MKAPENHPREEERLEDLAKYRIIDSEEEKEYDQIANLASHICGTKVSLISLIDRNRQWMKSCFGIDVKETSREHSFCGHAIIHDEDIFIIEDARKDDRFYDNPFVVGDPDIAFYAGVPLYSDNGNPLGTLCVIDDEPKELTNTQIEALKTLAQNVMSLMELRRKNAVIEKINKQLERKNVEIEQFADRAAHDIKAPLRSIKNMLELISKSGAADPDKVKKIMNLAIDSAENLDNIVDGLLDFARIDELTAQNKELISTDTIIHHLKATAPDDKYSLKLETSLKNISTYKTGLLFVLRNLVSNAIKYGDNDLPEIEISITEKPERYTFSVMDNGPGISLNQQERIFQPFQTVHNEDKFGQRGTGLGLSNIKKVIHKMNGKISVKSEEGKGATFYFEIPK